MRYLVLVAVAVLGVAGGIVLLRYTSARKGFPPDGNLEGVVSILPYGSSPRESLPPKPKKKGSKGG